jgi:hypothetical protein
MNPKSPIRNPQSAIRNPQSAIRNHLCLLHNLPMPTLKRVAAFGVVIAATTLACAVNPQWHALFDGTSLNAWRGYKTQSVPEGWKIVDQTLTKDARVGDLMTRDEFGDFELELEWKIGKAGNSGIFYRGIEDPDFTGRPNDDRIYTTGPGISTARRQRSGRQQDAPDLRLPPATASTLAARSSEPGW